MVLWLTGMIISPSGAFAWGPDGHHALAAIASRMIAGSHASTEVNKILGDLSLQDASVWADCAKNIDPAKDYVYQNAGRDPACSTLETAETEADMSDFVRRNDRNCNPGPSGESCHKRYHYTDIAIQHEHYSPKYVGARDDDIVRAAAAAIRALKGETAPASLDFRNKREALLVLVHYVGDIHQPLHVGAVYLDAKGKRVNPDVGSFDPRTETGGGNSIAVRGSDRNLHATWDRTLHSRTVSHADAALLKKAGEVRLTDGEVCDWPAKWADDALGAARDVFKGVWFGNKQNGSWEAILPARYGDRMTVMKKAQIVKAGARLAQLLRAIWP